MNEFMNIVSDRTSRLASSINSYSNNIMPRSSNNRVYVCQSGTCRRKGSDAALVEIEELAKLVGDCDVRTTDCLGYCRQGPAVEVVRKSKRSYHTKVSTLHKSAAVVKYATGEDPPVNNLPPEAESRLSAVRATKRREYFASTYQWNKALSGLTEKLIRRADLRPSFEDLLRKAGYNPDSVRLRDLLLPPSSSSSSSSRRPPLEMPSSIEGYVHWKLQSVEAVSGRSAIFRFATRDLKRGTPHPRGRARMADPITWHVTMLGEVGHNREGPLPWIERDYTPISSALEWERGRCDVLIKIYDDGLLSKWLREKTTTAGGCENNNGGMGVWLSKPVRTLSVPSLVAADDDGSFRPESVLLLLAGTGIVALPQILAHREPTRLLGISTPQYRQLQCPVDLIQSCREDDLLLLPEIKRYCTEGSRPSLRFRGLRNYTLLLTEERKGGRDGHRRLPYQDYVDENGAVNCGEIFDGVPNSKIVKSRLNGQIVADAVEKLVHPYRVVVSGPDAFNNAARKLLDESGVDSELVTMLSA